MGQGGRSARLALAAAVAVLGAGAVGCSDGGTPTGSDRVTTAKQSSGSDASARDAREARRDRRKARGRLARARREARERRERRRRRAQRRAQQQPPAPQPSEQDCDPSYTGACLDPNASDYDCAGGSGDGPKYAQGPIHVVGDDHFDLDRDGNGTGCQ